jgi:hypothetical protein
MAPSILQRLPTTADKSSPVSANPAVSRCCEAWSRVFQAELANGEGNPRAAFEADRAYCNAMPPLSGYENIRDFIACVAHAMLIGAIQSEQGSKLLYAAQVALCTVRNQPAPSKSAAL